MKKDYTKILELQNELSKKVITHDYLINNNISNVCGIDVSYKDLNAFCSAVIINKNTLEVIEIVNEKSTVNLSIHSRTLYVDRRKTFAKNCKIITKSI